MKIISYLNADGDCIVIQRPTDIYPLLDWCQNQMINIKENCTYQDDTDKWEDAIIYLSSLMREAVIDGFGSQEDVDNIEY